MQRSILGLWGAFIAAASLVGCGGKVVIDAEEGGQGGFGTTSGTNSVTGTSSVNSSVGPGTSTASTAAGGDPKTLCDQACDAMNKVPGCAQDNCVEGCVDEFSKAGACESLLLDVVFCVIKNAGAGGVCSGEPCQAPTNEYVNCKSGCTSVACSGGEPCECSGSCFGKDVGTQCFANPDGTATCVCRVGTVDVGKCVSPGGQFACDLQTSCCAAFF